MTAAPSSRLRRTGPFWLLLALVAGLCLPLVYHDGETNYTWDEANYYLPAVQQLRAEWPRLDLRRDALSATAPGYPYVLAGLSLVTGTERTTLRLLNLGCSLLGLVVLWQLAASAGDDRWRVAAIAPLALGNFFIKSASYVVTDNAALLAVIVALGFTLRPRPPVLLPVAGLAAATAVFVRQSAAWLVIPLAQRVAASGVRNAKGVAIVLLPLVVLGILYQAWGGLVPAAWRSQHAGGLVPAAGAYHLAVLALLAPFYAAAAGVDWKSAARDRWVQLGGLAGLVVAAIGPTDPSYEAGRWGGYLWSLAAHLPAPAGRSVLFLLAAPVGGALLALLGRHLWRTGGRDQALPWIGAQLAFFAAGLANRQVYHRYFEPTQLVLLVFWLVLACPAAKSPGARALPLWSLAGMQLCLTVLTAHGRTFQFL